MADRSSAGIFGRVLEYIAECPHQGADDMIEFLWREAMNYDFNFCQMELNDKAIKFYKKLGYIRTHKYDDWDEEHYWLEDFNER
jgi:hypothetical protein